MNTKIILGIETSCDDTSIALLQGDPIDPDGRPEVLAFETFSQEKILEKWGGVVPEIAARNHLDKLAPLLEHTFQSAKISVKKIDLIGVTTYPGLLGPLLTGVNTAKSLSLIYKIPIFPVNHLYAHLEAIHLTNAIKYPYLGLLVSGGHSLYMYVTGPQQFEMIGTTLDDAAGEAFDKGGKLLNLGYPAGRTIDSLARGRDAHAYALPIGLKASKDANLSFSGVKTALRNILEKNPSLLHRGEGKHFYSNDFLNLCASYQKAIVDALELKLKYALRIVKERYQISTLPIVVGGGVACNHLLRFQLGNKFSHCSFVHPKYCTDNGAMIANYALRNYSQAIAFPECLKLDAQNRFVNKAANLKQQRSEGQ